MKVDRRQLRLIALQRNIKALGTFGCQVIERRHLAYRRYIPRTLRHIWEHFQVLGEDRWQWLERFFRAVPKGSAIKCGEDRGNA